MSKGELIEARVVREQAWAYDAWKRRLTFDQMRAAAIEPVERGGLGYSLSVSALRSLVKAERADRGESGMGREERTERQSDEIDARARAARYDLDRAYAIVNAPGPAEDELQYMTPAERAATIEAHAKTLEAAAKTIESADRRLAAAQRDERDLFGLNAPTRIEAEVTQRDGVLDDLNAALASLGRDPVEAAP